VIYLTVSDVVRLSEAEVEAATLVDFGLLESAVLRPQQTVAGQDAYPDIHAKAAALMHSLIRNHPFVDGNKRTAVLAVAVFYGKSPRTKGTSSPWQSTLRKVSSTSPRSPRP
jgi:death-on-curing protein